MSQSFSNNPDSLDRTVNVVSDNITNILTLADDRHNLLSWLSPLDPKLRHQDIQASRVEGVGEWLLQTQEFRSWEAGSGGDESDNAVLFCYGDPGVGKTSISSLVVDRLRGRAGGQSAAVACVYFDFAAQNEQSPTRILGSLLGQLVCGLGETPEEISQAYRSRGNAIDGLGPKLSDIIKMMQTTSSKKRTFICIDALDECAAGHRVKLLDSLNQILENSAGTRIFVTGRPYIQPEIGTCFAGRVAGVPISPKRGDIIEYLRSRLREDTMLDAMDSSLEADILTKIPDNVSEIFLLVSLNIDAVLQETTIHRRRQKLNAMTGGLVLGDAYSATLGRIKEQGSGKGRLGMAALMWISHSERPLKSSELCHALAVEIGSPHLNGDNFLSIETLLACCQGLVVVDNEASTVRLIHYTLQEYLRAHPELFGTAHATMAETCLSYLNSQQVRALSTSPSQYCQETPFLEYSSLYWGVHAKRDLSDRAKSLALKLFDDCSNHISTKILLERQYRYSCMTNFDKLSLFSGLHCASVFGIVEIAASLVEMEGCDINQIDCAGNPPLIWAAVNGHEGVVNMLLGRDDVDPGRQDKYGRTPLWCATEYRHEGVVKLLLGRDDVNPDELDEGGQTPLHRAAESGAEGVVKILLGRDDVDPNRPGRYGQTPLHRAAENGEEGVVKILLGGDGIDPNKPDRYGQTPLHSAAQRGREGVVKVLLGRDNVDPDKPDNDGQTPFHCAVWSGKEGVVKILLRRDDVSPNKSDKYGQTPLNHAASNEEEGMVKILLGRDDVDPNNPGNDGQTLLHRAAESGAEGVVKVLLGRDDVDPNRLGRHGRTPLHSAAQRGKEGVVKVLLGLDNVDPDKPDNDGQTPLHQAVLSGEEGVVKMLLGRDDVDSNKPDNDGQTPLHRAARNGKEGVVKILLGRDNLDPDKPDNDGQTPLHRAVWSGEEGVVKILLGRNDVDPNKLGRYGQTPLHRAVWSGKEGMVKILLERGDVDPNKPRRYGQTPLHRAAASGKEGVVKILLGRDGVDPNKLDKDGRTPLWWAARNGHAGVVALLRPLESTAPSTS